MRELEDTDTLQYSKTICVQYNERLILENCATFHSLHFRSWVGKDKNNIQQLYIWNKGHLYVLTKDINGQINRREIGYMHFMHRKNLPIHGDLGSSFIITHKGFYPCSEDSIGKYFDSFGNCDNVEERQQLEIMIKKDSYEGRKKRVMLEFKTNGIIWGMRNIIKRYFYVRYLNKYL